MKKYKYNPSVSKETRDKAIKAVNNLKKEKDYRVVMTKFLGYGEDGSATYEITFNKSLEHTGRYKGIEDGLNAYCKKELKTDVVDNFKKLWRSLVRFAINLK